MSTSIEFRDYKDNYQKLVRCLWLGHKIIGEGQYAIVSHEFGKEVYLFSKRTEAQEYLAQGQAHCIYDLKPLLRHRCAAITKREEQCKRFASHTKEMCWQHRRINPPIFLVA